jgi:hypothetical protein
MSLGTSVFMSAVLLSIVVLFIATKDRWNWKKLASWLFGVAVAVPLVAVLGLYAYSYIAELPKAQLFFWDIPLGATESDVKFFKGAPTEIPDKDHWVYKEEKNRSSDDKLQYLVEFKEGKVRSVLVFTSSHFLYAPELQGIRHGASQQQVIEKFGSPSHVSISEDDLTRILSFEQFNLVFFLRENRVVAYSMYDPKFGPLRYAKEKPSADTTKMP